MKEIETDEIFPLIDQEKHQDEDIVPTVKSNASNLGLLWICIAFIGIFYFMLPSLRKWHIISRTHTPILSKNDPFIFIHIGKTGGTTVHDELKIHGFRYREVHVRKANKVHFNSNKTYVISIRNPIKRFVSAFNWRYHLLVVEKSKPGKEGEVEFLMKHRNVNNLAESLFDENGTQLIDFSREGMKIGHITESISQYLQNLKTQNANLIAGVIDTETLSEDMMRIFGIQVSKATNKNSHRNYSKDLSKKGLQNLIKFLAPEFEIIEKMNRMGLLTDKQYENLRTQTYSRMMTSKFYAKVSKV